MSEQVEYTQTQPDGENCEICGDNDHQAFECPRRKPASDSALTLDNEWLRQEYMGGQNSQAAQVAMLPERVDWDKATGHWKCESLGDGLLEMGGEIVGVVSIWAIWSKVVGTPECLHVGQQCENGKHEMGLRVIWKDDNEDHYYWDAFGTAFKAAQGAVRRAKNQNGLFLFDGRKQINTRFGPFFVPTLEKKDEVS